MVPLLGPKMNRPRAEQFWRISRWAIECQGKTGGSLLKTLYHPWRRRRALRRPLRQLRMIEPDLSKRVQLVYCGRVA